MRHFKFPAVMAMPFLIAGCATDTLRAPSGDEANINKLAEALMVRGDTEGATALYERAASVAKDPVSANIRLGQSFLEAGQPARAIAPFQTALNTDPQNGLALLGLGTAQLQSNQIESAVRALSAAAPLVKSDTAYNRLGTALILTGQATQAVSAFETAASIEPANLDTQTNISLAQALSGAQAQSVATARAVTTSPRAELRHFRNLMLVLVLAGQDDQAAAVNVPDGSDAEQRAFLAEARKIRALATPAARAQAIGLLGG